MDEGQSPKGEGGVADGGGAFSPTNTTKFLKTVKKCKKIGQILRGFGGGVKKVVQKTKKFNLDFVGKIL